MEMPFQNYCRGEGQSAYDGLNDKATVNLAYVPMPASGKNNASLAYYFLGGRKISKTIF